MTVKLLLFITSIKKQEKLVILNWCLNFFKVIMRNDLMDNVDTLDV